MKRDKTFGIYVPSYKRYDCIKTDKVLNDCTYVVRESEEQPGDQVRKEFA